MANEDEPLDRYDRFLQRYPVGKLSADELEDWVAMVLHGVGSQEGVSDFVVQMHERIRGVDGNFDLDATVRFRVSNKLKNGASSQSRVRTSVRARPKAQQHPPTSAPTVRI